MTPVDPSPTRDLSKSYLGAGGDLAYTGFTGPNCTTTGPSIGGSCFRLDPGDDMASFAIADDRTEGPIGGSWHFYNDTDARSGQGELGGSSSRVWVPEGATHVAVFTRSARG